MFIKVKNYAVTGLWKINNGFEFIIDKEDGSQSAFQFSTITSKFYHKDGKKIKLPKYLAKEVVSMACSKGIVFMNKAERENALYWL